MYERGVGVGCRWWCLGIGCMDRVLRQDAGEGEWRGLGEVMAGAEGLRGALGRIQVRGI